MTQNTGTMESEGKYAAAHQMHYEAKNLRDAIDQYQALIIAHPDSPEAGYSKTQVQNIANSLISKEALFDSLMSLVMAHWTEDRPQTTLPVEPDTP